MFVKSLDLKNFRNYERLSLSLSPGTNIFYGKNAQGKTNILEAVYMAGTTKSHRTSRDREVIRMGEEESHIRMLLDRHGNEYRIDMHLKRGKMKGVAVGGQPIRRAADLFSITSFVFFSPEDLGMIKNGPSARRKFLDLVLSVIDSMYMADLSTYGKILVQRNALLKECAEKPERTAELDIWDMQMAETGKRIIDRRAAFLEEFSEVAREQHRELTGGTETLTVLYERQTPAFELADKLFLMRDKDIRNGSTGIGPHRDDIAIRSNGIDLRTYGSQGQQRTAALSMKLSEIAMIERARRERPVLLLDDVLSELDETRQKALLGGIRDTQTLITCTGLDDLVRREFQADKTFLVKEGQLFEDGLKSVGEES